MSNCSLLDRHSSLRSLPRGSGVGVEVEIARRVRCPESIHVAGAGRQACVEKARASRGADLHETDAGHSLAPLDEIVAHPDVVGGGDPRQLDLTGIRRRRR